MTATDRVAPGSSADAGSHQPDPQDPADVVRPGTRVLLRVFVGLTSLAVVQLLFRPGQTAEAFAWHIHSEVTAAFIGAAYAAGTVLSVVALRQRSWSRVRIPVLTVTVFTWLTLVATVLHTHRLHLTDGDALARGAAWLWLAVYLVIPFACLAVVCAQGWRRPAAVARRRNLPLWLSALLAVQGAALAAAGAVLFAGGLAVHHTAEPMTGFWPWDVMPLSAQVIGAWLVAFGIAAALVIREGDLTRLRGPAAAYAVFGALQLLVLARYRAEVSSSDPWLWAYVGVLVTVVVAGGYGWAAARRGAAAGADRVPGRSPVEEPSFAPIG
ncbi:hypothetical protein [Geodermatophilus sp. CPCC 206100]|uniref:hypothetical protein n=1 Tax=Geodermatophilus sp. CPCC 206100 TaxID=3020054 RepID=UPI003AFFCB4C